MQSKKAFEIQFNWIFVLIAGAAILIFFSSVIIKQKDISQASASIDLLKTMESVIAGASASTDTTVPLDISDFEIKIGCNKVSIGSSSSQFRNLVLFAPSLVKGSSGLTQTLAFSEPYRSTNILFITSSQVKYILVGSDDLFKDINKTLPSRLMDKDTFSLYDQSKIKGSGNYKIKLVFFNLNAPSSLPPHIAKMPDSDVAAVKISGDEGKGTIDFYEKKAGTLNLAETSAYLGKTSLIAAIYAENSEIYTCNMNNVFLRNSLVTKVHKGKADELASKSQRQECRQIYANSLPHLNKIEAASLKLSKSQKMGIEDINDIAAASKSMADINAEAKKLSCPAIY